MPVPRAPGVAAQLDNIPAGAVMAFASATAPKGWLACDGTAVNRSIYARLFAVIGTTYGVGDGSTTFNLPDCTGRAIYGKESSETRITTAVSGVNGGTLGAAGGDQRLHGHTHAGTTASDGAHTHTTQGYDTGGATANVMVGTDGGNNIVAPDIATSSSGAHTHTFTSDSTGGGSTQNLPPAIVLTYIIKF